MVQPHWLSLPEPVPPDLGQARSLPLWHVESRARASAACCGRSRTCVWAGSATSLVTQQGAPVSGAEAVASPVEAALAQAVVTGPPQPQLAIRGWQSTPRR